MLDTLRRRLFCVASCVLMLSVTLLLAVFLQSSVAVQREAEVTYLQRMSFLLTSQLEKNHRRRPAIARRLRARNERFLPTLRRRRHNPLRKQHHRYASARA